MTKLNGHGFWYYWWRQSAKVIPFLIGLGVIIWRDLFLAIPYFILFMYVGHLFDLEWQKSKEYLYFKKRKKGG